MYVQIRINGKDQGSAPVIKGEDLPAHCNGLDGVWYPCDAYYEMYEAFAFDGGYLGHDMPAQVEEYVFYHLNEGEEEHGRHTFNPCDADLDFFGSCDITSIEWDLLTDTEAGCNMVHNAYQFDASVQREVGRSMLQHFRHDMGVSDTLETDAIDLIADVLHVCHASGLDYHAIARIATDHVEEEI